LENLATYSPLLLAALACAALAAGSWALSIVTGNYSQVDRLWSLAPPLYVAWFASRAGFTDGRLNLMLLLAVLWGARLTYNFARKGGYRRGSEDYRWPALRAQLGPVRFQALNAVFIAPFQNALLLLICLPAWQALRSGAPLGVLDGVAAAAFFLFFVGEAIADQQQWRFQSDKHARKLRGEPVSAEFIQHGLFRFSRHPNFFCEQAMWWSFYLFSVAAGAGWLNVAIVGPLLLTLLFQGSTGMTERLTLAKYPAYAEYQRSTPRQFPWPR
jgi:steroid 5-alpha reductase family enzyme